MSSEEPAERSASAPSPSSPSSPDGAGRRRGPSAPVLARIVLAVLLVGGLVVGSWVAVDLFAVRGSLQDARAALGDVGGSLGEIDIEAAAASLEVADTELAEARRRSGRVTWTLASVTPYLGASIDVTRQVVEVASAAVDLANVVVADGQALIDEGLDVEVVDGRVDLTPLLTAQEVVDRLPIDRLETARDALAAPRSVWLPDEVREGRVDTLALADDTLDTVLRVEALTDALPGFLGADGPRRYFVGVQTSAELRGTGGLIGYWGVLGVDDGQVTFAQSEVFDPSEAATDATAAGADADGEGGDAGPTMGLSFENPPDVDPEYLGRYATMAAARSFPNINLDPDLPTTAKAILDLYELRNDDRLDGVILLDPLGLQAMLEATGSTLPVGDELSEALGLDGGLPTDRFAQFVTADIYEMFGAERTAERDAALQAVGDAAILEVFGGQWEGPAMVRAVASAASQKHLQVMSTDEEVQAALVEVGTAGSLEPRDDADLYAVTANNAVGGKQDVHLGHEFRLDVALGDVRQLDDGSLSAARETTLGVTVHNPLPSSGMDEYIIGSCYVPDGVNECFEGEPGTNRTWFSAWSAADNEVVAFRADDERRPDSFSKTFRDLRVVDVFTVTDSRSRAGFELTTSGRAPLRLGPDSVIYELVWWRQAKAIPDLLDVRVEPPEGWAIDRVELVGGGEGHGSGVHGAGVELDAEVEDGAAVLRGTVTADTRLLVHLVGDEG